METTTTEVVTKVTSFVFTPEEAAALKAVVGRGFAWSDIPEFQEFFRELNEALADAQKSVSQDQRIKINCDVQRAVDRMKGHF